MTQTIRVELDIPTTTPRPDVLAWHIARGMAHLIPNATMSAQWTDGAGRVQDETHPLTSWPEVK